MNEVLQIIKDIDNGHVKPLYLLMGEESYFIDFIAKYISTKILTKDQRVFDQMILYGRDISVEELINYASRYPVTAERQVIVVREAQQLSNIDKLHSYTAMPSSTTILVLSYKYKTVDKRKNIYKDFLSKGVVFYSKKLYENQLSQWLKTEINSAEYHISIDALHLIIEALGTDIEKIKNEMDKLYLVFPKGHTITPIDIETYVGINRSFNNFELRKAIGVGDYKKASRIIDYFSENKKSNPLVVTLSMVYNFFIQLLQYHGLSDYSKGNVAKVLGINPYFVSEYQQAARRYPMKQISRIINSIKKIDLKSKGVDAHQLSHDDLLKEMLIITFFEQ